MQIQIVSTTLSLGDSQKEYIKEKIENLSKYEARVSDEATIIRVDVENKKFKAGDENISTQITMYVPNAVIRAELKGTTVEETIDLAVEKLKKQIERYKTKKHRRGNDGKLMPEPTLESATKDEFDEMDYEKIVKRKKHESSEPMREDEAIDQMELLGHDFYAFENIDTGLFSVVYRRQDGAFGLIELEKK